MNEATRLTRIAGAVAEARPMPGAALYELARVGASQLLAEVIRVQGDTGTLQIYEETTGLSLGEPVVLSGETLTAQLGPGLLGSVLDGVGRPLFRVAETGGDFIEPGVAASTLDPSRAWAFEPRIEAGSIVESGDVLGTVEERPGLLHSILVPPGVAGTVATIDARSFTADEPVGALEDGTALRLCHRWPVRRPRPYAEALHFDRPLVTGQRVFDFLFPVAEGGSAAVPGGFGTGKTIIEHSLAKFADAEIVVFVGCGERGNEMTEVLSEFPELTDPRTGRPVMDRSVLVVNTSNMPVAARESSIYLGATISEYYRDMGFRVALMVDSISRWAEALREISSRMGEMPGEEGYPTYLASRLGKFYERAARVRAAGRPDRDGAVTVISAVSPPGGDFSEPVTQASLRVTGAMWALDADLAHERHFPAVDWDTSYSFYGDTTEDWYTEHGGPEWAELRKSTLKLLQEERELRDIASLVGPDALEDRDRLTLEAAATFREIFLRQSAFHPYDALCPVDKTYRLATLAYELYKAGLTALEDGRTPEELDLGAARQALVALRDAPDEELDERARAVREAIDRMRATEPGSSR